MMAGSYKQVLLAGLYISTYGKHDSQITRTVLQYRTVLRYFTLRELKFTALSMTEPRGYEVVATRFRSTFSPYPLNRSAPAVSVQI
jgi:hypothetical protein